ncbi:MAG: hypothetical protein IJX06_05205 [Clostridia bacterium]|nr:hypothetical protein [Clostridia bacterium]
MFKNIDKKIKGVAIICTIAGCILSIIYAINYWSNNLILEGFLTLLFGCLFSWIGSFVLYGFGELITQTTNIAKGNPKMQITNNHSSSRKALTTTEEPLANIATEATEEYELDKDNLPKKDECPCCFNKINPKDKVCSYCGYKLK